MPNKRLTETTKHIAIMNKKGGVGKTALTILMAQSLLRRGYRVLIIDCDSQHNTSDYYNVDTTIGTTTNMMVDDFSYEDCVQCTPNGDIIASDKSLADLPALMTNAKKSETTQRIYQFQRILKSIEGKYDFVFFDTHAMTVIDVMSESVLNNTDYLVIPISCRDAVVVSEDFLEQVDTITKDANPSIQVLGIVHNMFHERYVLDKEINALADEYIEDFRTPNPKKTTFRNRKGFVDNIVLFKNRIRFTQGCRGDLANGFNPYEMDSNNNTVIDVDNLVNEFLEAIKSTPKGKDLVVKKLKRR